MSNPRSPATPPLEWTEEDQHLIPLERRRFGPHFEKPCRNPDTIVCAARSCQAAYSCRWGTWPAKKPEKMRG